MNNNPLSGFEASVEASDAALKSLEASAAAVALNIDAAFSKASDSLARSLGRAAADGKISMDELASAIIAAVNSAYGSSSSQGLGSAIEVAVSAFYGARADGGIVSRGGAYLVGERGPEVFSPASSGQISSDASLGQTITINLQTSGDARSILRSEAQLASALNRAARLGIR
jgi:SLT domain-containing protein